MDTQKTIKTDNEAAPATVAAVPAETNPAAAAATLPAAWSSQQRREGADILARYKLELAKAELEERLFALDQRKIMPYAKSDIVPLAFREKIGNCLIAKEMAERTGATILSVMQNLYVVHGNPSWSSTFAISAFNTCGRFSAIRYRFDGEGEDYGCTAYSTELATGAVVEGPKVSWRTVKSEGWLGKSGSKWKTLPELMFRYRAAAYLIRTTAPELLNGLRTVEEVRDMSAAELRETETRVVDPVVVSSAATEAEPARPADKLRSLVAAAEEAGETAEEKPVAEEAATAEPEATAPAEESLAGEVQAQIEHEREEALKKARATGRGRTTKLPTPATSGDEPGNF